MSLAMPGIDRISRLSTGASRNSLVSGASDGFTSTSPRRGVPLTASPCTSARRSARQAPMERPARKTCSVRPASATSAASTAAYQSVHPVCAMPCQVFGPRPEGLRTAGEAMAEQHPDRPAGLLERFGAREYRGVQGVVSPWFNRGVQGVVSPWFNRGVQGVVSPWFNRGVQGVVSPWFKWLHARIVARLDRAAHSATWDDLDVLYWLLKVIFTVLRIVFRPWSEGARNLPRRGPVILASNHLSFADHFFGPLPLRRKVIFLA